jgi:hypothetical protein
MYATDADIAGPVPERTSIQNKLQPIEIYINYFQFQMKNAVMEARQGRGSLQLQRSADAAVKAALQSGRYSCNTCNQPERRYDKDVTGWLD